MARVIVELEHFSEEAVARVGGPLDPKLLVMLQAVRYQADVPIFLTSGLRETQDGAHGDHDSDGDGEAVDISDNPRGEPIASRWRFLVKRAAYAVGFGRVGDYDRHLHLDVRLDKDQDVEWRGVSR